MKLLGGSLKNWIGQEIEYDVVCTDAETAYGKCCSVWEEAVDCCGDFWRWLMAHVRTLTSGSRSG